MMIDFALEAERGMGRVITEAIRQAALRCPSVYILMTAVAARVRRPAS